MCYYLNIYYTHYAFLPTSLSVVSSPFMHKKYFSSTITIVGIAIFAYLAYTISVGYEETLAAISRLGFIGIWFILGLSLVNYGLRFIRWHWYLSIAEYQDLTLRRSLRYYLAGFAFTTTPGKAGEMIRSIFLKNHNVSYPQSLSLFFVERLSDLLATLLLGALILLYFDGYEQWIIVPVVGAITLLAIMHQQKLIMIIQKWVTTKISSHFKHLFDLVVHSRQLLKYHFLYGGLGLGLIAWAAEGYGFYYILQIIGIDVSLPLAMGIYSISLIIGALSFLPGGLGGTEAAMLILLGLVDAGHEEALAATLICRFATLWFAVALGAIAMVGLKIPEPDQKDEEPVLSK